MKKWQVYLLTFPNGKKYCGRCLNLERRARPNGEGYTPKQPKIYNAIKEFGWENIKKEILFFDLSLSEANEKEIEIIEKLDLTNVGYNMLKGGNLSRKDIKQSPKYFEKRHSHGKYKVAQYDLNGSLIKIYNGAAIASKETKSNLSKIVYCCNGKRKKTNNFIWKKIN